MQSMAADKSANNTRIINVSEPPKLKPILNRNPVAHHSRSYSNRSRKRAISSGEPHTESHKKIKGQKHSSLEEDEIYSERRVVSGLDCVIQATILNGNIKGHLSCQKSNKSFKFDIVPILKQRFQNTNIKDEA